MPVAGLETIEWQDSLTQQLTVFIIYAKAQDGEIRQYNFTEQKRFLVVDGAVEDREIS